MKVEILQDYVFTSDVMNQDDTVNEFGDFFYDEDYEWFEIPELLYKEFKETKEKWEKIQAELSIIYNKKYEKKG